MPPIYITIVIRIPAAAMSKTMASFMGWNLGAQAVRYCANVMR